eukprot:gene28790-35746_t
MKFDCGAIIAQWQESGKTRHDTAQTMKHATYSMVAMHVEQQHLKIPGRLIRAYITERVSYRKNKGE